MGRRGPAPYPVAMSSDLVLWLFVITHSIAFGAGFYEQRVVLPLWFGAGELRVDAAAMRALDPGRKFWAFVSTGPLTLLTVASLILSWNTSGPRHDWWLGAACVTLLERVATFSYFIPTAIKLMRSDALPAAQSARMAARWRRLNHLRVGLSLFGWLAALKALTS